MYDFAYILIQNKGVIKIEIHFPTYNFRSSVRFSAKYKKFIT